MVDLALEESKILFMIIFTALDPSKAKLSFVIN